MSPRNRCASTETNGTCNPSRRKRGSEPLLVAIVNWRGPSDGALAWNDAGGPQAELLDNADLARAGCHLLKPARAAKAGFSGNAIAVQFL
jgi:hypothetical protein